MGDPTRQLAPRLSNLLHGHAFLGESKVCNSCTNAAFGPVWLISKPMRLMSIDDEGLENRLFRPMNCSNDDSD